MTKKLIAALSLFLVAALAIMVAPAAAQATVVRGGTCPTVLQIPEKVRVLKCATGTVVVYRWQTTPVPVWVLDFTV
jgi:hypothetical protein